MAFAYLNLPGRIWQANGLKYLLSPQDLALDAGLCAPSAWKRPASPQAQRAASPLSKRAVEKPAPETDKARSPVQENSVRKTFPLESWPQQWRAHLSKAKRGRFAWTYMDLGKDLLMSPTQEGEDPENALLAERKLRSQCLRRLFADLAHPPGTHTFWPIALPSNDHAYLPNVDCFWSGLEQLECRGVVIMGSAAAQAALGTKDLKPLSQLFKFGKLVWILWEAHNIAANPLAYDKVLAFLRRSLGNFIKI